MSSVAKARCWIDDPKLSAMNSPARARATVTAYVVTAALFVIGKELIGLYLALSNVTSTYGAAGSIIVLLIFTYFTATIVLLGAEFTKHYARRLGSQPPVDAYAVRYRMVTEVDGEE